MPQSDSPCRLRHLDHLVLTVASIPVTMRFYAKVLGMIGHSFRTSDGGTRWGIKFGTSKINLHQKGHEFQPRAARSAPGTADLCFLTDAPLDNWMRHLTAQGIEIEDGPVRRTGATGPIMSIYVRDPDGNLIEIAVQLA